MVWIETVLH